MVVDRDRGYRALMARLREAGTVRVGVQGDEAGEEHPESPGVTVAEIAEKHEFGVGTPRRSWLRDYVDAEESRIRQRLRNVGVAMVKGQADARQGLELLGLATVGEIQERISRGIPPPLSETRIRQKTVQGREGYIPLIDTGHFRSSITHVVKVRRVA